jgi:hypothetical protein
VSTTFIFLFQILSLVSENNASTTDGVTVLTKLPLHTCLKTLKLRGLDQEEEKIVVSINIKQPSN